MGAVFIANWTLSLERLFCIIKAVPVFVGNWSRGTGEDKKSGTDAKLRKGKVASHGLPGSCEFHGREFCITEKNQQAFSGGEPRISRKARMKAGG